MSLQHEHILNPITALAYYQCLNEKTLILAGEGSFLKIIDANTSEVLSKCNIFDGQVIHGIVTTSGRCQNDVQILIWGGSSLTLLTHGELEQILEHSVTSLVRKACEGLDWILDGAISLSGSSCCYLITAHNTILQTRFDDTLSKVAVETLASPSRSILYSAHLIIEPSGDIMIAAGTVFGEIIVWSCSGTGQSQVLFVFTGHEGSIFGVNISPPLSYPGKAKRRLLASCSDDRTIRVWDLGTDSRSDMSQDSQLQVRETGFGGEDKDVDISQKRCVATVMAHASRIWHVKFIVEQTNSDQSPLVNLLSFGEDSVTQHWRLDRDPCVSLVDSPGAVAATMKLVHMNTYAFHRGKHIWSTALRCPNASIATVATGGADGKISSLQLHLSADSSQTSVSGLEQRLTSQSSDVTNDSVWSDSWDLETILDCFPDCFRESQQAALTPPEVAVEDADPAKVLLINGNPRKKKKAKKIVKDAFNKYAFVSENKLLFTTTFGRIICGNINQASIQWEIIRLPAFATQDIVSYSIVQEFTELGLVFIASARGNIYAYNGDPTLVEVGKVDGKAADIFKIFDPTTESFQLLVTTLAGVEATLFSLGPSSTTNHLTVLAKYALPDRFIVTSAGKIDDLLILGSRSGSLIGFDDIGRAFTYETKNAITGSLGDGITSITPLPGIKQSADRCSYFITTGRDGVYSIFAVKLPYHTDVNNCSAGIRCVHIGSLPFGPMVESAWFSGTDLLLYGFKSTKFVVWDETQQLEVLSVDCGGAHRSYAYSPIQGSSGGRFAYTKAARLYIHSQDSPMHKIIKHGGHGREIKACAVSPDKSVIATGAEDTTIRFWTYDDHCQFTCLAKVQRHSAGIQHLQWHGTQYLLSSGGNEEFFIWAIEHIPGFGIGVVCEATCPDLREDRDLRIMGLDVSDISDGKLLISLAYSDSTIRTYTYSKKDRFHLTANERYTTSCLTKIQHLLVNDEEAYILTTATDGNLTLWKAILGPGGKTAAPSSRLIFFGTKKLHQSTIKSLDLIKYASSYIVVTGGDDNALGIAIYPLKTLAPGSTYTSPRTYILRSAHAAAVTGLSILLTKESPLEPNTLKIVSSSNDQRVKEWHVELSIDDEEELQAISIHNNSDEFTSIADVGDLAVLRDGRNAAGESSCRPKVLIVGNGMEVWNFSK